mmetsp:Transcript_12260/g.16044  ORF Transcript_12260/g.16044 Transcript_12260/m.16044 type:complete len:305 (+) Transcript_12260:79-993(+)
MVHVSANQILNYGLELIGETPRQNRCQKINIRIDNFRSEFGSHPLVYAKIYRDLGRSEGERNLKFFLICIFWFNKYDEEKDLRFRFGHDEDTIRKYNWHYAESIALLREEMIKLPKSRASVELPMSVDGTHCRVPEPLHTTMPFDKGFSSHKFGGKSGLAYEIGVNTVDDVGCCWISDPFPAGHNDKQIFRKNGLQKWLVDRGKKAIADEGYEFVKGGGVSIPNSKYESKTTNIYKRRARARHEAYNGKIKTFNILKNKFRCKGKSMMRKHNTVFVAVCVIVSQHRYRQLLPRTTRIDPSRILK